MNDTMGKRGQVPAMLVFGALPPLPVSSTYYRIHQEPMAALKAAGNEMTSLVADSRIPLALSSMLPPAARFHVSSRLQVSV